MVIPDSRSLSLFLMTASHNYVLQIVLRLSCTKTVAPSPKDRNVLSYHPTLGQFQLLTCNIPGGHWLSLCNFLFLSLFSQNIFPQSEIRHSYIFLTLVKYWQIPLPHTSRYTVPRAYGFLHSIFESLLLRNASGFTLLASGCSLPMCVSFQPAHGRPCTFRNLAALHHPINSAQFSSPAFFFFFFLKSPL